MLEAAFTLANGPYTHVASISCPALLQLLQPSHHYDHHHVHTNISLPPPSRSFNFFSPRWEARCLQHAPHNPGHQAAWHKA